MTMMPHARTLGTFTTTALLWCAGCPATPQPPPPPPGGLAFAGGPAEALVTINESLAGTIAQLAENPVHLQAGTYRVQVAAPGHFPWYGEIAVGETVETVTVELRPVPE